MHTRGRYRLHTNNFEDVLGLLTDGWNAVHFLGYFEYNLSRTDSHGLGFHPRLVRYAVLLLWTTV